jgi:Cysteine-rich secretory protein family
MRWMMGLCLMACATISHAAPPTFEERLLAAHNGERSRLGQAPLSWSTALAKEAASWAQSLAKTNSFEHDTQDKHGENLWMGTKDSYSPEAMVGLWIDERAMFKPGRFPDVSTTGKWIDVGHYTQLVWQSTRQVGCALATNAQDDYLVCRYDPPGNWVGQDVLARRAPIQPPKTSTARMRRP